MAENIKQSKHCKAFNLVQTENGVIITAGNYKLCEKSFETYQKADDYIGHKPYDLIFTMCNLMIVLNKEQPKTKTETKKKNDNETTTTET